MFKRQNSKVNFVIIFFMALFFSTLQSQAQSQRQKLQRADSLFAEKQYTQSFEIYEDLLKTGNAVTPAMLLKMAYIREGLNDYALALYYINLYYLHTSNDRALRKMAELAEKHKLSGYAYDDARFFLNLYHKYQDEFYILVMALALVLFSLMLYQKKVTRQRPIGFGVFYLIILTSLFYLNNFALDRPQAIIDKPQAYLMKGPSSASGVYDVIDRGHRVYVLGKEDVWIKIRWQEQEVYIRENNLRHIQL